MVESENKKSREPSLRRSDCSCDSGPRCQAHRVNTEDRRRRPAPADPRAAVQQLWPVLRICCRYYLFYLLESSTEELGNLALSCANVNEPAACQTPDEITIFSEMTFYCTELQTADVHP